VIELTDDRSIDSGFVEVGSALERLCDLLWEGTIRVRQR
jgi:hypothetical protein